MLNQLSTGVGACAPTHRIALRAIDDVLETGAFLDFIRPIFQALHRVNRHAASGQYLAIALPGALRKSDAKSLKITAGKRGLSDLGETIEIFGTEASLEAFLADEAIRRLARRGMVRSRDLRVKEVDFEIGDIGVAMSRNRSFDARSEGARRRQEARDARRAEHIAATKGQFGPAKPGKLPQRDVFLSLGEGKHLDMVVTHGAYTGEEILVTTYGLSSPSRPAILPVSPERAAENA